jgi:hypothetical protein
VSCRYASKFESLHDIDNHYTEAVPYQVLKVTIEHYSEIHRKIVSEYISSTDVLSFSFFSKTDEEKMLFIIFFTIFQETEKQQTKKRPPFNKSERCF